MRWSTAEKVNAGFAVALAIVSIMTVASITSIQRFANTARELSRTHAALTELQSVLASLTNAESAQRGYLISADPRYLEPYTQAARSVTTGIHRLRERTFFDPDQQHRLALLAAYATQRIRLLDEVSAARVGVGPEGAAELMRERGGRELMDTIRTLASTIEAAELARLEARNRSATLRARVALAVIGAGGVFAFLAVLLSSVLIRRDYTERRRAEHALRESETLLSQFMENLPIGVIVVDAHWRPRFANNAAVEVLGPRILIDDGSHPLPLYRAGDHRVYPADEAPLARALTGQTASVDDAEVRVDDRYIPVQVSAAPIYDASGRIAYTIAAFSDVTERRRSEEALRSAKDTAETASRSKSDFLARMSHELRTPLNSVIGFANILLKNRAANLRDQDLAYIARILDNGKHLLLLINDILDLSKIEAGKIELETETVDLNPLIRDVTHQFEEQLRSNQVQLRLQLPATLEPILTDAARLRQIMFNLVGNAVKFTERGHITVAVDADPATHRPLRIRVSDTGIGISEERLKPIFDAFEQAESTTARKYGGTGLGLPISRALCELLGYSLSVRSHLGIGTEFSIDMTPQRPAREERPARLPDEQAGSAPRERLVLIVDDEADSRILLTHYVEEFGCRAIATHSAANALKLAKQLHPDLITLDLMMPELNGWSVLSALKEDPELASIPVVVVSIVAQDSRATLFGAIDLLQKPLDRDALFTVLRRNIGARRGRVLIVEDDDGARDLLRELIGQRAEEIRTAENGQQALTVLRDFEPDVVLVDLLMPVMDGMTFLEVFRATPRFQHVPVIVVTAKDLTPEERERLGRHMAAVLRKGNALEGDLKRVLGALLSADEPAGA